MLELSVIESASEIGGRIETVDRFHRLLAQTSQSGNVDLQHYLYEIGQAAIGAMGVRNVSLLGGIGSACEISATQALSVGFIVGEAVTNAVKYAHPTGVGGRIDLSCEARPMGAVLILISDDGVGLPESFNIERNAGLGLRLMHSIASQLGGSLSLESSELGLTVRLLLPPASPSAAA